MAAYSIVFKKSAEKDLRKIPAGQTETIFHAIAALEMSPAEPPDRKLVGSDGLFRKRVGNYRVIYEVDQQARLVIIHYIRHRREAYRQL